MDRISETKKIKFYLEALLNSSNSHMSKPLALGRSTYSVFNKTPVQIHSLKVFPLLRQSQRFPHKQCLQQSENPSNNFYNHIRIPAYYIQYQMQNPASKHSIKLPPLTIQNFNGIPLEYHEWIIRFFASYITKRVLPTHIVSHNCKMQLLAK